MAEQSDQFRYGANPGASVPMPGEDVPVNPYSLLGAVNDASEIAHTGWIVFLSIVAYLCVAVAGITHRDLLLNTPVPLPVLGVDIDLTAFFLFAPIILVFIHFGLLVQHVLLARKVLEFHAALRPLEPTERRSHPLRLELYTYNFTQSLAGADRSPVFAAFLHAMIWLSVVALPVLVILFIQITFLPYHDVSTTWVHRILLVADIGVVIVLGVFLALLPLQYAAFSWLWRRSERRARLGIPAPGVTRPWLVWKVLLIPNMLLVAGIYAWADLGRDPRPRPDRLLDPGADVAGEK